MNLQSPDRWLGSLGSRPQNRLELRGGGRGRGGVGKWGWGWVGGIPTERTERKDTSCSEERGEEGGRGRGVNRLSTGCLPRQMGLSCLASDVNWIEGRGTEGQREREKERETRKKKRERERERERERRRERHTHRLTDTEREKEKDSIGTEEK